MSHPLQSGLWSRLLRVQAAKVWAIELGTTSPVISRWASGERPMSLDDLSQCLRICRRLGEAGSEAAHAIRAAILEEIGAPTERAPDPLGAVLAATEAAGVAASTMRAALADGVIDDVEADRIDEAADRCESAAGELRAVSRAARRARGVL